MKNKYCIRSRISEVKFREIIRLFSADIEAKKISELTGFLKKLWGKFSKKSEKEWLKFAKIKQSFLNCRSG